MFFLLSKVLLFIIQPFTWILFLVVWMLVSKSLRRKKILRIVLISFLFVFSNTVVYSEFIRLWEIEGVKTEELNNYEIGIVLGGMSSHNNDLNRLVLGNQGDRIWQTLHLYHIGKIKKILISGDSGYISDRGHHEAAQMEAILLKWGIPDRDILVETKSKNTHENAKETVKLLKVSYPHVKEVLLITSASHMRRSKACFAKEGMEVDVFTVNHQTGPKRNYFWDQYFVPEVGNFSNWNSLIKEWVGYVVYDIVGYI